MKHPRSFVAGLVCGLLMVAVAVLTTGCGSTSSVTPGSTRISQRETIPLSCGTVMVREAEAVSTGPGATASGDKIAQDFSGSPAELTLPGGASASGGGFASITSASTSSGKYALIAFGVLSLLAGGFCIYAGIRAGAVVFGVVGVLLIAGGLYPALLLWLLLGGVAAAGGYALWSAHKGKSFGDALAATTRGIESLAADAGALVKQAIAKHAKPKDKATITSVKAKEGI